MKKFEWDHNKRNLNMEKHHIDFIDAINIFNDIDRLELEVIQNGERRHQVIGIVNQVVLFVVYANREEKKRIISARRASKNERKTYFSQE
jgi:uncharacterized DUF497 family protein